MSPGKPLTRRQKEILDFVTAFVAREGLAPTHREICEEFGFSSYGTVEKHLRKLREKGYLEREDHQRRGIKLPGGAREGGQLPFLGRIAAGRPIEALPGYEEIAVPEHLCGAGQDEHYVLEVVGDSMIGEGIHEGDLVVVRRREDPPPGSMVVALVGDDATLKRFYPEGELVRLQPANPAMKALRVPASELRIQGTVVGLMRRY